MCESASTEIAGLLHEIGWSSRTLAARLDITDSTVRHWMTGRRTAPDAVVQWLRGIRDRLDDGPEFPEGWGR